jgi:hypothetical protein
MATMIKIMTKGIARDIARQAYGWGYFSPGEPGMHNKDYVPCPLCRERLSLTDRPYPRNLHAPSSREIREAIEAHLLDRFDDSRCSAVAAVRPGSER